MVAGNAVNANQTGIQTFTGTAFTGSTVTQHGVLVGGASNAVGSTAVGSTGQVLQANTGADPTYSTATFPSTATGTGTILRADGTNWVATTATYPATTTSQQILYSTADNVIGQLTTANSKLPATNASGTLAMRAFSVVTQVFTATGASTYTPTAGMLYCVVELVAGGGGGGATANGGSGSSGAGGGGGAGGYARKTFSAATIGISQTVTINTGGAGGNAGANPGNTGGSVTFGALLSATGGAGGSASTPAGVQIGAGGAGGVGSSGDFNCNGAPGGAGFGLGLSTNPFAVSGVGGSSLYGGGGKSSGSGGAASAGVNGTNYGSGGSGAAVGNNASSAAGGNGTTGIVIVTEYVIA